PVFSSENRTEQVFPPFFFFNLLQTRAPGRPLLQLVPVQDDSCCFSRCCSGLGCCSFGVVAVSTLLLFGAPTPQKTRGPRTIVFPAIEKLEGEGRGRRQG